MTDDMKLDDWVNIDDTQGNEEFEQGPNQVSIEDMTPRQFSKSVLGVYYKLGGDNWLLNQAKTSPREFFSLLRHVIPKGSMETELKQTTNADKILEHLASQLPE